MIAAELNEPLQVLRLEFIKIMQRGTGVPTVEAVLDAEPAIVRVCAAVVRLGRHCALDGRLIIGTVMHGVASGSNVPVAADWLAARWMRVAMDAVDHIGVPCGPVTTDATRPTA
ncbi:hypothetical protein J421_0397 [Gemmatirosa kalamazoonensis]|jgi:hypothetical protein|uniref:Uncharacterized protein n=2 Tax=Gemmatirosa kalamazoonensis TaxID=861299 RepID=W0R9Z5_9BACT|nr:hypothetical protein J421_0397 [Gemmatirosa kalamazoonensis]